MWSVGYGRGNSLQVGQHLAKFLPRLLYPGLRFVFSDILGTSVLQGEAALPDLAVLLPALPRLSHLNLREIEWVHNLSPLTHTPGMERLDVSTTSVTDLRPLSGLAQLRSLEAMRCPAELVDLGPLRRCAQLTRLRLNGCIGICDLSPLSALGMLAVLDLSGCISVYDLSPLAAPTAPTALNAPTAAALALADEGGSVPSSSAVPAIGGFPLHTATGGASLPRASGSRPASGGCPHLQELFLNGCPLVVDASPLISCPELRYLDVGMPLSGQDLTHLRRSCCGHLKIVKRRG